MHISTNDCTTDKSMGSKEFLTTLYGDLKNKYLYLWTLPDKKTHWYKVEDINDMAIEANKLSSAGRTVYFSLGAGDNQKQTSERLKAHEVTAIPGLWIDVDIAGPGHKAKDLPTNIDEAMEIIHSLPLAPSIIVHSGGGIHAYWLFDNVWILDTPEEKEKAAALLLGIQTMIKQKDSRYKVDSTHSLAQILRPPGTRNYKDKANPKPVMVIELSGARYSSDDFEQYVIEPVSVSTGDRGYGFDRRPTDGPAEILLNGCKFIQHCRDNAEVLTEPYWMAMITNLARCKGGPEAVHAVSESYPTYSVTETNKKIGHALNAMAPATCQYIKDSLQFCDCPDNGCNVKSPWGLSSNRGNYMNLTDVGNAERMENYFGETIRYCFPWKKWLVWDGKRWAIDEAGRIMEIAKQTVRRIYKEALESNDADQRKAIANHARKSEAAGRLQAMISLATSGMPVSTESLDADIWLLNCQNGTLNLRSGQLRSHSPADLITKIIPVAYNADAFCPLFEEFLKQIFNEDQNLIAFVQRYAGLSLSGIISEQCLAILYGTGANGKSVLMGTLSTLLGDYVKAVPPETLMAKRNESIPNDIAMLQGARLVMSSETDEGSRLAEARIKSMTGGEKQTGRFLHGEFFSFLPQFKIWLATNHIPKIRGGDKGIWRRIRMIPFNVTIPDEEQDKELEQKLKAELPGILAWAVRGFQSWQKIGLGIPDAVKNANDEYRVEMDVIQHFIDERCKVQNNAQIQSRLLYEDYRSWATASGEYVISETMFSKKIAGKGFSKKRSTKGINWYGIGLVVADFEDDDYDFLLN